MPERHVAILGAGIAGLATAVDLLDEADRRGLDLRLTVLEAADAPGGNLRTLREDGWQLEWGPNGFLDNEPATLRLIDRLGLRGRLVRSSDVTRHRFLLVRGRLVEIPVSPGAFIRSPMLPWRAKLRMLGELFMRPRRDLGQAADRPETDESVFDFGARRLGREFAEVMLDPMVKGIFGGDARWLSLAAAFPRMVELERDHGGLFRAMIALARKRRNKTDAGPGGVLHSFTGGMQDLVSGAVVVLEADPRCELVCGARIESVRPDGDGAWRVEGAGCPDTPQDAVIDASPAHAAASHLAAADAELARLLAQIPLAPMAVIALGFAAADVRHDLQGFGLLVPTREQRDLLGALWTSSIFPGRAPAGSVLLRCMAGGAANPGIMGLDDEELVNLALSELRPLLGIQGPPAMARVIRHTRAIAQYVCGHPARLKALGERLERLPGLHLTGSSYRGISVNSCCKEAETLAARVAAELTIPEAAPAAAAGKEDR